MAIWYAICDRITGKLKSVGTVITSPLKPENEAIELGEDFDQRGKTWDEKLKIFVDRPDPILESIVQNNLSTLPELSKLTLAEKTSLFKKLALLMERGSI